LIARDVGGRGCNHVGRKSGRRDGRVQAFGRRRSGDGFEFEQIGDGFRGRLEFEIGSVDNFRSEGCAAGNANGLRAVMGFLSAGATGGAGLSSAQIFGAGKFVGGVVDDFIGLEAGCGVGTKAGDFAGNDHQNKNEQCL